MIRFDPGGGHDSKRWKETTMTVHETRRDLPAGTDIGGEYDPKIVLGYVHRRDGGDGSYSYGVSLCLWRGEFVIWAETVWDDDRGMWTTGSGDYFAGDVVAAASAWAAITGEGR